MAPQGGDGDPFEQVSGSLGESQQSPGDLDRNTRYRMTADLAARDDDYLVLNDAGQHSFRFSGQAISHNDTIRIENLVGRGLYVAPVGAAKRPERIVIFDGDTAEIGSVVRHSISPLRDRFSIELQDELMLTVEGNVPTHEFSIVGPSGKVAEISQRWFRARGSYGVEIVKGQDDALLLTAVVVLDQMILGNT